MTSICLGKWETRSCAEDKEAEFDWKGQDWSSQADDELGRERDVNKRIAKQQREAGCYLVGQCSLRLEGTEGESQESQGKPETGRD